MQEDRGGRHSRLSTDRLAKASRIPTCAGAASRRRFSFRNPRMRKQSSSATAKTVCRSSLAMEMRRRRLRGVQRPTGTTTRKGPRLRVRLCRWRKRLLLHWRHRPKRYRLPVRVLRRAPTQRGLARFGRSVYLISKPILRRCYSQLSGKQSLALGPLARNRAVSVCFPSTCVAITISHFRSTKKGPGQAFLMKSMACRLLSSARATSCRGAEIPILTIS